MSCRIEKKQQLNQQVSQYLGLLHYIKPDSLSLYYTQPQEIEFIQSGDSILYIDYQSNRATMIHKEQASFVERKFLETFHLIIPNYFKDLTEHYSLKIADTLADGIVYQAIPKDSENRFAMLLIKINPVQKTYVAFEIFNQQKELISQTKYDNFKCFEEEQIYFPQKISTKLLLNQQIIAETIHLKRLKINQNFLRDPFNLEIPKGIKLDQ